MLSTRTRSRWTSLTGLLAVLVAGLAFAAPATAADNDIKINEVESSGGTPGDWIELVNTGTGPVDLSNWVLKDNDDTHVFTIPAGTTLAAGAFRAFDVEVSFGLGAADSARVYTPGAATLIDSYSWTAHAAVTYGRCPDGTGSFVNTLASTKGTANACLAPATAVKINEVESSGGTPGDWIELVNTASTPVDISNFVLKDNDDTHTFTIPAGTTLASGAFQAFDVEAAFGLGSADSARLYTPGAATLLDSYSWTSHAAITYGRCPDGSGAFTNTTASTKGAANACAPTLPRVVINEVESNGDTVGDWVELRNTGTTPVNISGWNLRDNDPSHAFEVVPANTTLQPGGYYSIYTEFNPAPGFGLGAADSANLYLPDGTTLVDSYSWTAHATTTYGRCPDGTGSFVTTTTPTRNAANACSAIRINEIQPNGGAGGDWVELKNIGSSITTITGWKLQDVASGTTWPIPTIGWAGGTYAVIDQTAFGFDMAANDTLRLLDNNNAVIEEYSWTSLPPTSFGRCKDGLGPITTTKAATRGTTNSCPGLDTLPWPGGQSVTTADNTDTFVQDLSGLVFDPNNPDVLWGAQNKKGTLFKLVRDANNNWVPADGWPRDPKFLGGTGSPDTEGITIGPDGFVYVTSERDNDNSGVSRNTILRFDPNSPPGATISPTSEWDLNTFLPTVGANLGLEGVTFVPDSYLVAHHLKDQSTGQDYNPADYPLHGSGLYFVAVEADGSLVGFALDSDGHTVHKITTSASGLAQLADVDFDPELGQLRAVADDTWDGETVLLAIDGSGSFVPTQAYDRPAGMPNLNNEGLAIAPQSRCVGGTKEVLWSDDGDTDGHSIRRGTINCTPPTAQVVTFTTDAPSDARVGQTYVPAATGGGSGNPVVITVDPASASVCSITLGVVNLSGAGTCSLNADQDAAQGYLAGHANQSFVVAKAAQTVTFAQPGDTVYGGADVPLSASASSGLPVTLTSETPAVCTIVAGKAHPVAAGTCTVTATQGGDSNIAAATPVSRSLTVAKAPITMTTKATSTLVSLLTLRVTYTTTVKSTITGLPAAGIPVTTRLNGAPASTGCTAVTNAAGVATCTAGPVLIAILAPFTATAAETSNYLGGTAAGLVPLL